MDGVCEAAVEDAGSEAEEAVEDATSAAGADAVKVAETARTTARNRGPEWAVPAAAVDPAAAGAAEAR